MTNHSGGGTPKTDAVLTTESGAKIIVHGSTFTELVELARQLERELSAAQSALAEKERENGLIRRDRRMFAEKLEQVEARAGEAERLRSALGLIWTIYVRKEVHLGLERYSGFEQNCIACIAALALGQAMNGTCGLTADDFNKRREQIKAKDAAPPASPAGEED